MKVYRTYSLIGIWIAFGSLNLSFAQSYLGISNMTGKIIKHDPTIPLDVPQTIYGFELSYRKKLSRSGPWTQFWNHPHFDLSLGYSNFNDTTNLGTAYSISPGLQFFFFQKRKIQLGFRINIGVAYVSKTFNDPNNIRNTYISSHINDTNQFALAPRFRLNENWDLDLGIAFTHYSNGGLKLPNKGINTIRSFAGLYYKIKKSEQSMTEAPSNRDGYGDFKKIGINIQSSLGLTHSLDFPQERFKIYTFSLLGYYKVNPYQSWLAGFEFEHNESWSYYELNTTPNKETPSDAANSLIFTMGHELEFGPAILRILSGVYFEREKQMRIEPFFFKLQIGTKIPIKSKSIGVGLSLKSHYFRAENISMYTSFYF